MCILCENIQAYRWGESCQRSHSWYMEWRDLNPGCICFLMQPGDTGNVSKAFREGAGHTEECSSWGMTLQQCAQWGSPQNPLQDQKTRTYLYASYWSTFTPKVNFTDDDIRSSKGGTHSPFIFTPFILAKVINRKEKSALLCLGLSGSLPYSFQGNSFSVARRGRAWVCGEDWGVLTGVYLLGA